MTAGRLVPDARPARILRFIDICTEAYFNSYKNALECAQSGFSSLSGSYFISISFLMLRKPLVQAARLAIHGEHVHAPPAYVLHARETFVYMKS